MSERNSTYTFPTVVSLWFLCYIVYPVWLIRGAPSSRLLCLIALLLYFVVLAWLFHRFCNLHLKSSGEKAGSAPPQLSMFARVLLLAAFVLHVPLLSMPIRSVCDEGAHMSGGIQIFAALNPKLESLGVSAEWAIRIVIVVVFLLALLVWRSREKIAGFLSSGRGKTVSLIIGIPVLLAGLAVYFYLMRDVPFHRYLYKPMPVSRFVYLPLTAVFGASETMLRLPGLLWYIVGGIYVYRLAALLNSERSAEHALGIYLFLPPFFYFAQHGTLGSGTVALCVIPLYYLVKALEEDNFRALAQYCIAFVLSLLWKRALFLNIFLGLMILILYFFLKKERRKITFSGLTILGFGIATILPMMVVTKLIGMDLFLCYVYAAWEFGPSRVLTELAGYVYYLPAEISPTVALLSVAGLIIALFRKRTKRITLSVLAFAFVWYVPNALISLLDGMHERHVLPVHLFAVYFSAIALSALPRLAGRMLVLLLCLLLLISSTIYNLQETNMRYMTYRPRISGDGFPAYGAASRYLRENAERGSRVLASDMPDGREFYDYKFKPEIEWVFCTQEWTWTARALQTRDNLFAFCLERDVSYVLVPEPRWLVPPNINLELVRELVRNDDPRFSLVKDFEQHGSHLYLFGVSRGLAGTR